MKREIECLGRIALAVEEEIKHPVIMEFSYYEPDNFDDKFRINPLQARKLTKISDNIRFSMPQLQDKGLIASTYDVNGTGDFTGEAFVITKFYDSGGVDTEGLREFDKNHPKGYVFVTPYLQFWNIFLDDLTPNKKGVVAYSELGKHHDMEIARKKGTLYLNFEDSLGMQFFRGREYGQRFPIETGEIARVVSDGEEGFLFNLSR